MAGASQRRAKMATIFAGLGVEVEFFDAIEPPEPAERTREYDHVRRMRVFGRPLRRGEIGCFLSHRALWRRLLESHDDMACILEDDLLIADDFQAVLTWLASLEDKWDLVRLMRLKTVPYRIEASSGQRHLVALTDKQSAGTQGYLLNRQAAEKLLSGSERFFIPVDDWLDRDFEHKLRVRAVEPNLIEHDVAMESTIGGRTANQAFSLPQKLRHECYTGLSSLRRKVYRLCRR